MSDYLSFFPKPFLEDLVEGRCLPFIGAGFSMNAVVPVGKQMLDWDGLGRKAADALPDYQYTTALEALSAYCHEYTRVKLVEFLSDVLLISCIRPSQTHEEFCRMPFERVVTTNFDFLLEHGYSAVKRYCIPQIAEEQLSVASLDSGVQLLKIHGDLHHPNRLVVTEENYDSFLAELPLLATHLSSLLIGHTAFFIGYSLDDPDFRQIWHVVKERLGLLRRPAYVLQVGAAPHAIARYERRGVKVINLPRLHSRTYAQTLEHALRELREYWSSQVFARSTTTEPESQAELSLPPEAQTRLTFFAVPTEYAAFYKAYVYPIAERYGFSPVMAADVVAPGDNLMAKVYALLDRATLVVADIGAQSFSLEVGMILSSERVNRQLIIISDGYTALPFDIKEAAYVSRSTITEEDPEPFLKHLENAFASAFKTISPGLQDEPNRLLAKKEYRAAVIAVFSSLEHELRQLLESGEADALAWRATLPRLLDYAQKYEILTHQLVESVKKHSAVRNRIAHTRGDVTATTARTIVNDVSKAITLAQKATVKRRSSSSNNKGQSAKTEPEIDLKLAASLTLAP